MCGLVWTEAVMQLSSAHACRVQSSTSQPSRTTPAFTRPSCPLPLVCAAFDALLGVLDGAELANVRQYQDTIALVLLRSRPGLLRARVLPRLADCSSSASHALSSLVLIAARAAAAQLRAGAPEGAATAAAAAAAGGGAQQGAAGPAAAEDERLVADVVAAVAPWALSHVHALRCALLCAVPA